MIQVVIQQVKNGITLMLLIGKFLEKFGSRRAVQTVIFIDEGWAFSASRQGKKSVNELNVRVVLKIIH